MQCSPACNIRMTCDLVTSGSGHDADQRSEEPVGYPGFHPIALRCKRHDAGTAVAACRISPLIFPVTTAPRDAAERRSGRRHFCAAGARGPPPVLAFLIEASLPERKPRQGRDFRVFYGFSHYLVRAEPLSQPTCLDDLSLRASGRPTPLFPIPGNRMLVDTTTWKLRAAESGNDAVVFATRGGAGGEPHAARRR